MAELLVSFLVSPLAQAAAAGFLGGIVRALVGIMKWHARKKRARGPFKPAWLAFTIIASGIIGLFAALLVAQDLRISLLAGYAGTDLVEGVYKAGRKLGRI